MRHIIYAAFAFPALLTLAACGSNDDAELASIDNKIGGKNDTDPALTAALEDQIMVDPTLSAQSNEDAVRPAPKPNQSPVPAGEGLSSASAQTLGSLASAQSDISKDAFNGCGLNVDYSMGFAAQLPADFPLMPKAQVVEAAGSNDNGCKLRAVTHNSASPIKDVAAHYSAVATRAGYKVGTKLDGKGQTVSGKRAADGGAFYVVLTPIGNGTSADLVINNGR
jgi:hypothetical protein